MKNHLRALVAIALCLNLAPVYAQFGPPAGGGGPGGPNFGGSTAKLFGDNTAFSATLEIQTKGSSSGDTMTMPGKMAFADGKSRFETDVTEMKGGPMPPGAMAQVKAMGMDRMTMISRPDKKLAYVIYPGLQAYAEMPLQDSEAATSPSDYKVEATELGKEIVDGHACVKNKAVVSDSKGNKHEATVWNATDLKKFPVKIEQTEQGTAVTMLFKNVQLAKPEASVFDPPASFKKYDSVMAMMQQEMMKRMSGGAGAPPPGQ